MLGAWRGQPAADTDALADLMVKLSQFAADHADDIAEIDLNPVIVHNKGDGVSRGRRLDRQTRATDRSAARAADRGS